MTQIWQMIVQYRDVGMVALILIQMIILSVTIHLTRKLTQYVKSIHEKVLDYLQVVMAEEMPVEENVQADEQHVVSGQERQMVDAIAQKKKMQQEALFNAVLQEIFP